ncbi:MAG: S24/S26 family peptidase [Actinomycetota bacterium]|nr:S24/S26 family peptidase [Actinomycetota bacterium]
MLSTRGLWRWVLPSLLVAAWRRYRPFPVRVAGPSMLPTLRQGDRLAVSARLHPRRGDLVIARRDGLEMVKRVRRLDGNVVEVAGDNAAASTDFSAHVEDVVGVAVLRYWPAPRWLKRL